MTWKSYFQRIVFIFKLIFFLFRHIKFLKKDRTLKVEKPSDEFPDIFRSIRIYL